MPGLAAEADGAVIATIEGEAAGGELSEIQAAFAKHQAVQCGFCTSGMILSIRDLLARNPKPTIDEIKDGIEGNFCRCTATSRSSRLPWPRPASSTRHRRER